MKNFEEDFQIFDTKASARPISIPSTYNDRTRLVYEAARCGLRDFFRKNGYRKASIGLSGGIDSAVVASIAADALGAENVRALLGTDIGVGVTGLAGPGGDGVHEVGTVFVAMAAEGRTWVRELHMGAHRTRSFVRRMAGNHAYDMMRRYLTWIDVEMK